MAWIGKTSGGGTPEPRRSWSVLVAVVLANSWLAAGCGSRPTQPPEDTHAPPANGPEWVTEAVTAVNVEQIRFYSRAANAEVSAHIYLPDAYKAEPSRGFPVLYWLHGGGVSTAQGIPFLAQFFHDGMTRGFMEPTIVVFPNGLPLGMWVDSKDGRQPVETVLMTELIPLVDRQFRALGAQRRVVEGFSMGGYGAARLGFKYPDQFSGISLLGAGPLQLDFLAEGPRTSLAARQSVFQRVYGGCMEYFQAQSPWRLAEGLATNEPPGPGLPVRIAIGTVDEMIDINRRFHDHLTALGIPHTYIELAGVDHSPVRTLQALGEALWAFYNEP